MPEFEVTALEKREVRVTYRFEAPSAAEAAHTLANMWTLPDGCRRVAQVEDDSGRAPADRRVLAVRDAEGRECDPRPYVPEPRPAGSPPVFEVPLRMIESRRCSEEACATVAVEAATADEALALVRRALDLDSDSPVDFDELDWEELDVDCVGSDVVQGPEIGGTVVKLLPDDHPVDLRAADFEEADED